MLYWIANHFLEKKISRLRPVVRKLLKKDKEERGETLQRIKNRIDKVVQAIYSSDTKDVEKSIDTINARQQIEKLYILLNDHLRNDQKRRYILNVNYCGYLEALKYLYSTSSIAVSAGVFMAPPEIYLTLNKVQKTFTDLADEYHLV